MTTFGIDISHHQGVLSLAEVVARTPSIEFAIAKLSEGEGFRDPNFGRYATEAKEAGLLFAGYHFLRGDVGVINQAKWVKTVLAGRNIPVIIDLERTNGTPQPTMAHLESFMRAAEAIDLRISPLLYLPEWYWAEIGHPETAQWDIWQSDYGSNVGIYPGNLSARWSTMGRVASVLQYTSQGRVSGYFGPVDLNAFRGTRAELAQQGWLIDYKEDEVATKDEIQLWVATTPIVVDGAGTKEPLQKVLRQILNRPVAPEGPSAEEIVTQLVAALPPDEDLTQSDVQAALETYFRARFGA